MRPLPGSFPNLPQGNLERECAFSSNFRDSAGEIILIPGALAVDEYGSARMDQ
jgi:hypothetical protein